LENAESNLNKLSLRWIWVAWLALGFTVLGFVAFGMATRGDPTPVIEELFGDTGRFAFLVYTLGQVLAVVALVLLARARGQGIRDLGFRGRLTRQGIVTRDVMWQNIGSEERSR